MENEKLTRRDFVRLAAVGLGAAMCPLARAAVAAPAGTAASKVSDHVALAYEKLDDRRVRCKLCPRECTVMPGGRGYCGVRENHDGVYRTLVYARPCAVHIDPIEKKPLFHFMPGALAYSIGTAGCNVECKFCQNWEISQSKPEQVDSTVIEPTQLAEQAKASNCRALAYTYNEPTVFFEYILDCAREGNKKGLRSVVISNGFINAGPVKALCKELSAYKVDLKGFTEEFYSKYTGGQLAPVLKTLKLLKELGIHAEVVNLLIPGANDKPDDIRRMAGWVVENMGPGVPVHFTRFHPAYKMMNLSPTPIPTIEKARETAKAEGVRYAYVGNVPGHEFESTFCHNCGKKIIARYGMRVIETHLPGGKCEFCKTAIPGVWS